MKKLLAPLCLSAVFAHAQLTITIPNASGPSARDITVNENGTTRTIACNKENVFVRGNKNIVTVTGICGNVNITGNENTVTVDRAERLVTVGDNNTVNYRYPNMAVSTPGLNNKVHVIP